MKPSIPQGNRDFAAQTILKRRYITDIIREVFEIYGFEPLETPAMENLETLMGKYGEEGDKLIFKILNNGLDHPAKTENAEIAFKNVLQGKNDKVITERALRYDLTIPFARHLAMNYNKLTLPFKRYQIQPVWRADKPQRGRYREFYQCDVDVAGTYSLIPDAEFVEIYARAFKRLQIRVAIKLNNRKILTGLAEVCGAPEKMTAITIAIDKLDKIGLEKVKEELQRKDLTTEQIRIIENYINLSGTNAEKLQKLETLLASSINAIKGVQELRTVLTYYAGDNESNVLVDPTLARGLDYYTGTIYEIQALDVKMGSIGGGGRYDNLLGLFGIAGVPGVGISFGLDRIFDVMEELALFPQQLGHTTEALFFNMGEQESQVAFKYLQKCRNQGVRCELFYETVKMDKQFKYATRKSIPYAVIIGSEEIKQHSCFIKELATGLQEEVGLDQLSEVLHEKMSKKNQ